MYSHRSILLCLSLLYANACAQEAPSFPLSQYETYKEPTLVDRRFKHADIVPLIRNLPGSSIKKNIVGTSIEGRDIYLIKVGRGSTTLLLWSQMHGNEPTATMAIFDLLNFFAAGDSLDDLRNTILDQLTLYFIPMLNPDGAERYQRRNALDVDLNRDALRLQCPESRILKTAVEELSPDWGFNLHDQNRYSSAGKTPNPASLSFLAPAYDEGKSWNKKRTEAMQLIVEMNALLQQVIPDQVGRYSDEFEPRAFGDNIQKWGVRTILIETGAMAGDPEKQYLRKLNFAAMMRAFQSIIDKSYMDHSLDEYEKIPVNHGVLHDLIIRNGTVLKDGNPYILDIGFRKQEINARDHRHFQSLYSIADLGDLHTYHAYEEIDAEGLTISIGRTHTNEFTHINQITKDQISAMLKKGITTVRITQPVSLIQKLAFPLQILGSNAKNTPDIKIGDQPALLLSSNTHAKYAIINGQIYNLEEGDQSEKQGR